MKRKSLIWQIYPSYLLIVFISIFALGWYFLSNFRSFHYERTREELTSAANMLADYFEKKSIPLVSESAAYDACLLFGRASGYRFTVVLPSGEVVGDSEKEPGSMDNHADRPEIKQAIKGEVGSKKRYSNTLRMDMLYVAVPIQMDGTPIGVVRCALSLELINTEMLKMRHRFIVAALLLAVIAVVATMASTRGISAQLAGLSVHSAAFGRGELDEKLPSSNIEEIDVLASSMNRMADQLNARISTIVRQRDEQNVLFACMVESVLAVDNEKRLIRLNAAARDVFGVDDQDSRGKNISEVIRHSDLLDIIDRTLGSTDIVEGEIYLDGKNLYLQAHGSILKGDDGERIGALIVLNDITRLRILETMRRDFVANVSHELKTPITSIKGFVDTLIDTPVEKKEDKERFMQIISQQINRLQTIIDDLMSLSKLEHDIEGKEIELQEAKLEHVLRNAIQICSERAKRKEIAVNLSVSENLSANINVQLLEQAAINLIDNAVKYSETGTSINVTASLQEGEVVIKVADQGAGIPHNHLNRIFERFYRVDKSRSRKLGGTGLGLAIVKHVAIAHSGRVGVESEMDKGTTFSLVIPAS